MDTEWEKIKIQNLAVILSFKDVRALFHHFDQQAYIKRMPPTVMIFQAYKLLVYNDK